MEKLIKINYICFKKLIKDKLLLLFLFFVLLHRLYYFNYFYVPNSDFFAFNDLAQGWLSFNLPENYARLPLYPWVIGAGSLIFLNNQYAMLYSAEIVNLLLSIVSLYLVYLISSMFLKKMAFLVVFLAALNPLSVFLTSQPLLETLLLTTILSSIYLDLKENNKRYFFAFLASMTRYEGFLLIPILVLKDLIYSRRKIFSVILGFLSSGGMIIWMILSYLNSPGPNPYVQATRTMKPVGPEFIITIANELISFIHPDYQSIKGVIVFVSLAVIFILMIIGFFWFLKKSTREIFTILLFLISYIAMHMVFSYNLTRFVYPVLWILILFTMGGIEYVSNAIIKQNWFHNINKNMDLYFRAGFSIFSILTLLSVIYFFKMLNGYFIFVLYMIFVMSIIAFMFSIFKDRNVKNLFLISSFVLILCVLAGFSIYGTQQLMDSDKYTKAEFRFVGEWYSQNAKSNDKILMTEPWIASYYSDLSYEKHFLASYDLKCNSPDCFISEIRERNITYVVWDSYFDRISKSSLYYNYYKIYLISDLREGKNTENFELVKKIEIGPSSALIYKVLYDVK
ncbi:MAG: hypothetical protein C3F06_04465 [Candidatus Methanoperedenaceae archaeon]|nr:MAG: hypothetical protein C3F06_04465 [Candidatus Methanoperedenaceae archaeon]